MQLTYIQQYDKSEWGTRVCIGYNYILSNCVSCVLYLADSQLLGRRVNHGQ